MLPGLVVAAAVALLALLVFGISSTGASSSLDAGVADGHPLMAPDASTALPVLGASTSKSLRDYRGKVVVLNMFASWCPPCKTEAPILEREQQRLAGHNATVVGVTYLDTTTDAEHFVRNHHINYPVLRDVSGNFSHSFGVDGLPATFVIDRAGKVVAVRRYQLAGDWLQQTLSKVLAQQQT
jgi:cytochrome c biogenesis protein CcmG/thiol:disulfide interchange protein DsbE